MQGCRKRGGGGVGQSTQFRDVGSGGGGGGRAVYTIQRCRERGGGVGQSTLFRGVGSGGGGGGSGSLHYSYFRCSSYYAQPRLKS